MRADPGSLGVRSDSAVGQIRLVALGSVTIGLIPVPEPGSGALVDAGMAGVAAARRKRRSRG